MAIARVQFAELPDVLFKHDLARVLGCSVRTIERRMRFRNDLPPMMAAIDNRARWAKAVVQAWVEKAGAAHRFRRIA
jgi:hypothetical protein